MKEIKYINILKVNDKIQEKVRQWRNKEEIRKYMLSQHIITKEEHLNWIESLKDRNDWKFWVVFIDEIPIGSIYLQSIDYKKLTSEWGFYIGEDNYRGCGMGVIIEYNLLEYFFKILNFNELYCLVLETNQSVLRMDKKFGFKEIKKTKHIQGKKYLEFILLKIIRKDWFSSKKNIRKIINHLNIKFIIKN